MPDANQDLLTKDQIMEIRAIFEQVADDFIEQNLSMISESTRSQHRKAIMLFYKFFFLEKSSHTRPRSRPASERKIDPLNVCHLKTITDLELKISKLAMKNASARRKRKHYIEEINKIGQSKYQGILDDMKYQKVQEEDLERLKSTSRVLNWLIQTEDEYKRIYTQFEDLESRVLKTSRKIDNIAVVASMQFKTPGAEPEGPNVGFTKPEMGLERTLAFKEPIWSFDIT